MGLSYSYVLPPTGQADNGPVREMFDDVKAYVDTLVVSGSAAPVDATYVTLSTNATLTTERVLTAGSGISLTDNGAGSTIVVANIGVRSISTTNVNFGFSGSTGAVTFTFSPTPTFSSIIFQSASGAIGVAPSASVFTSYNLTLPLDTGSSGYVLQTNGATPTATLSWVAQTAVKGITGTTNQISVNNTGDPIVLSTPQDIATGSSPTFSQTNLTGGTSGSDVTLKFNGANNGFLGNGTSGDLKLYTKGALQSTWTNSTLEFKNAGVINGTGFKFTNGSGNVVTINPKSSFSDYTLTLPADDGTINQFLQTDGSGVLTWADFSSLGATKALDNLASVAINTALLPGTTNSIDLGSTSKTWRNAYIAGDISFQETGGGTDTVTIEAPSAISVAYALKLPTAQAAGSNYALVNDGSGNLSWSSISGAGGATTALNNLASVAVNTALLPGTDNSIALGSASKQWTSAFLSVSAIVSATSNQLVLGTTRTVTITAPTPATTSRIFTVPDIGADGTFMTLEGAQTLSGAKTFNATLTMASTIAMGSHKITGLTDGSSASDAAAFGQIHLLQLPKFAHETTGGSTGSTTFVDAGASVSITPTSASSTIMIWATAPITNNGNNVSVMGVNGTTTGDLTTRDASPARFQGTATANVTFLWFDTPGTTATQTYKMRLAANAGTAFLGGNAATGANTVIMVAEVI